MSLDMDIDKIKLELPSQLADICRFSFDFSNLMNIYLIII